MVIMASTLHHVHAAEVSPLLGYYSNDYWLLLGGSAHGKCPAPLGPENISQLNKKTKGLSRLLDNFQPYQETGLDSKRIPRQLWELDFAHRKIA
jgi:hypothetical protein